MQQKGSLRTQLQAEIRRRLKAQSTDWPTVRPDSWSLGNDIGASLRSATGSKVWPIASDNETDEEYSSGPSEWEIVLQILEDIVRNHTHVHGELYAADLEIIRDCEADPSLDSLLRVAEALDSY